MEKQHSGSRMGDVGEVLFARAGSVLHMDDSMLAILGADDVHAAVSQWNFTEAGMAVVQCASSEHPAGVTTVLQRIDGACLTLAMIPSGGDAESVLARCLVISGIGACERTSGQSDRLDLSDGVLDSVAARGDGNIPENLSGVLSGNLAGATLGKATFRALDSASDNVQDAEAAVPRLLDEQAWHDSCDELTVGIFLRDSRGRFLECNNAFKRLFGWWENAPDADAAVPAAVRRLLGNRDSMLWNTGIPQEHIGPLEYANDGGMLYTVRTCLIRLSGSGERVSVGSVVAVHDDSGIAQLEAERNLFRAAFDRTGIPTVVIDENGYFKYVNTYFCRKFGYTRLEAEGVMHFSHCFTPRSYESMKAYRERRLLGDDLVPTSYESEMVLCDGTIRNVLITANIIPGTRYVVSTAVDITDQIEAQRGHALLAHCVDRLEEWVSVYSLNGSFLYANNAYKRLVGVTDEEFRAGITVADALARRFDQKALTAAYNALKTTGVWKGRMEYDEAEYGRCVAQGGAWCIEGPDGYKNLVVSIGMDISEQIRLEERVIAAEKMEAVGVMTASIAHDFNNLLSPLLLNSQRVLSEAGEDFVYRSEIEDMAAIAERGKAMVAQVMDLSRNDAHEIEPVELCPLVEQSVRLFQKSLPNRINLELHMDSGVGMVPGSPVLVHQIVSNLLFNARQAMQEGGITVTVRSLRDSACVCGASGAGDCCPARGVVGWHQAGAAVHDDNAACGCELCSAKGEANANACFWEFGTCALQNAKTLCEVCPDSHRKCRIDGYVVISVRDEGEGIPDALRGKVFEPFFTTRNKGAGVGLGLSIVKRAVDRMGGCVLLTGGLEQGACFAVLLPRCVDVSVRKAEPHEEVTGGGRIVIVDDDADALHAVCAALEFCGYTVTGFTEPESALAMIQEEHSEIGLVLVDLLMPTMRGDEFLMRLRRDAVTIPCVLCTGYSAELTPAGAKQMGFADVIFKPLELDMLTATVARILGTNGFSGV